MPVPVRRAWNGAASRPRRHGPRVVGRAHVPGLGGALGAVTRPIRASPTAGATHDSVRLRRRLALARDARRQRDAQPGVGGTPSRAHLAKRPWPGPRRRDVLDDGAAVAMLGAGVRALNRVINFPFPVNPVWFFSILRAATECRADYILVRDLPLALTALAVGRRLGIPVDRTTWPRSIRSSSATASSSAARRCSIVSSRARAPRRSSSAPCFGAPTRSSSCPTSRGNAVCGLGVARDRVVHVGNTPTTSTRSTPSDATRLAIDPDLRRIRSAVRRHPDVGSGRRPTSCARCQPFAPRFPRTRLIVAGDGDERRGIERLIAERGLESCVELLGWREHASLPELYATSDVGLLPFLTGPPREDHVGEQAVRLHGRRACRSSRPIYRRCDACLEETQAGVFFQPGDQRRSHRRWSISCGIPRRDAGWLDNGRRAATEKYNWREDEKRFLEIFDSIGRRRQRPAAIPARRSDSPLTDIPHGTLSSRNRVRRRGSIGGDPAAFDANGRGVAGLGGDLGDRLGPESVRVAQPRNRRLGEPRVEPLE